MSVGSWHKATRFRVWVMVTAGSTAAMQLLPPLTAGSLRWHLPLADPSAAALAEALLADPQRRPSLLRDTLAEDAALTLWAVARAARLDARQLDTVEATAAWLSQQTLAAFDWEGSPHVVNEGPPNTPALRHWSELTARSVAAAVGAAELAELEPEVDPQRAYLLGLLHAAPEWLAAAGPGVAAGGSTCLPEWLLGQLSRLESAVADDVENDPLLGVVAEALRVLSDRRRRARSREFDPEKLRALGNRAARYWAGPVPGAGRCLPTLIERLNRLEQLTTQFAQELERRKLAALKEFAYGAGHEINNPLANIATRAQTLLRNETDPERRRALSTINSQVFRAHEMITDVMLFARPPQLSPAPTDLVALVDTVLAELQPQAHEQGTQLEQGAGEGDWSIVVDRDQLTAAIKAMCLNSLEILGHGGVVRVELQRRATGRPGDVQIIVHDSGPGIPADIREHIFDPFFSGREAGRGLGFGLSKAWRTVTDHGGSIEVDDRAGQGATFIITLPAEPPRPPEG